MTVNLKPCYDSPAYRTAVCYDATFDIWYLYDKSKGMYIIIERKNKGYPIVSIGKTKDTEYYMRKAFEDGHKFYWSACGVAGMSDWIDFAPTNVKIVEETMKGRKTTSAKKIVRKPATRKPARK